MANSSPEHWDAVYAAKPVQQLGWYEPEPEPSLELIQRCRVGPQEALLDVGSGATTLITALLERGYEQVYALDISAVALERARAALGEERAARVHWIHADITLPENLGSLPRVSIWHDRAVLHFFLEEGQRQAYRAALYQALRPGGYAIIAAFATGGATRCSGLDVHNYDRESLVEFLGPGFQFLEGRDILYRMPSGDTRLYVYTLFRRF